MKEMTKNEIIEKLAREKTVEKFISNTAKTYNENVRDLAQDIYLALLQMDDEKIEGLYERGEELEYFVARMICNQYRSQTSPFYTRYRKWDEKRTTYDPSNTPNEENKLDNNPEYRWMRKQNSSGSSNS